MRKVLILTNNKGWHYNQLMNSFNKEFCFKSMLALTFTNKASAEMKYRILLFLNDLKHQRNQIVLEQILKTTSLDESAIQKKSSTILEKILYNYSNFNVITIDIQKSSCFNKHS